MLELAGIQPAPKSTAPADSNILGGRIGETIKDTDQTMKFYHDVLGFETKPAPPAYQHQRNHRVADRCQGSALAHQFGQSARHDVNFELLEFKDVPRKAFDLRVPDIGSPAVSIHVKDVESAMKAVAAGGGSIVTRGGEPVKLGPGVGRFRARSEWPVDRADSLIAERG